MVTPITEESSTRFSYNQLGQRRSTWDFTIKRVIRVGDLTSHGGKVLASGAPHFTVNGIAVAPVGAPCICPNKGHKHCKIATIDAVHAIDDLTKPAGGWQVVTAGGKYTGAVKR